MASKCSASGFRLIRQSLDRAPRWCPKVACLAACLKSLGGFKHASKHATAKRFEMRSRTRSFVQLSIRRCTSTRIPHIHTFPGVSAFVLRTFECAFVPSCIHLLFFLHRCAAVRSCIHTLVHVLVHLYTRLLFTFVRPCVRTYNHTNVH